VINACCPSCVIEPPIEGLLPLLVTRGLGSDASG
jgi:hypothetical protein